MELIRTSSREPQTLAKASVEGDHILNDTRFPEPRMARRCREEILQGDPRGIQEVEPKWGIYQRGGGRTGETLWKVMGELPG